MLTDHEIDQASRQLASYRQTDALSEILDKYSVLIEDYRRLKSDYEEERDARERYKKMAKGGERNPFVVVLIDGDGYVFDDDLVTHGDEGGSKAAQLLHRGIRASLQRKGLEHCQIIVRIYANVTGLSKALHKAGLVGNEKRSLAGFIAGFNRSYGLSDFVDAGELKENADFKLRALLNLYADNAQCKHVYFGACHDVGYISDMTPYRGNGERVTLMRSPSAKFHDEFVKLGLPVEEFPPGLLRQVPLDTSTSRRLANSTFSTTGARTTSGESQLLSPAKPYFSTDSHQGQGPVCRYYPQGNCKYGEKCKNLHIASTNGDSPSGSLQEPRSRTEGREANNHKSPLAPALNHSSLRKLPRKADIPEGHVAVNKNNFRLDPYILPVPQEVGTRLRQRADRRRICNNFHLNGSCAAGDACEYDHSPLDEEDKRALEWLARSNPCPKRGICRNTLCTRGHICQVQDCPRRGGKGYCKLPISSHHEDLETVRYVATDVALPVRRAAASPGDRNGAAANGTPAQEDNLVLSNDTESGSWSTTSEDGGTGTSC
ncbi:hypothetical protein ACRE_051510 [Hapsidospora chrysogenum ATCC 11550]|uniref:C3H1-type domain-containing protein n=1 Tax=Hapsidospora chrysogenum (strain ATCC 11550 / CBS 779.69 / DSM 880 / IAM 14645 / JCM 23072 / IMI 49137) TaxID=857340 RepID=A0A086T3W9_HAPC1|nr:hypothetical protein ACRE_051510 [Hapsidospora chrysogenum ATCC 11550]